MTGAARKCKACSLPVKGHVGPTGLGKCKSQLAEGEEVEGGSLGEKPGERIGEKEAPVSLEERGEDQTRVDDQAENKKTDEANAGGATAKVKEVKRAVDPMEVVDVVEEGAESSEGTSVTAPEAALSVEETLQEASADGLQIAASTAPEEGDLDDVADKVDHSDVAHKAIGGKSVEAPGKAEGAEEAEGVGDFGGNNVTSDSDDTEVSHFLPTRKVNLVKQVAKIGALSSLPEEPLVKSKKVDVKELVKGHNFTICLCKDEEEGECDCEGLMEVTEDLQGTISNAYMDPLSDYESDFSPELSFAKTTGWKKAEPNVIKFKLGGVTACGIKSSKGEVVLTADEVLNEDGNPGVVIRANMNLQLGVNSLYTKRGFKNPLKFKSFECNLLERVDGESRREDRGSQTEEDEDDGL